MATGPWVPYNEAKKYIANGTISLASTVFRVTLHTSASNAGLATLSIYNELTGEVTELNGYSSSGKQLSGERWTVGMSTGQMMFDADDLFWSAAGGPINNVKWAVVWLSAVGSANRKLLCRSQLSSAQFIISAGNRITLQIQPTGDLGASVVIDCGLGPVIDAGATVGDSAPVSIDHDGDDDGHTTRTP